MSKKEAMTVTKADKIKAILDTAKRSVNGLYDRLVKDTGDARRRKEQLESALHDATMEAGAMINTIVKGVDNHDKAGMLTNWRMRFKEERESIESMVEANNIRFDETSELSLLQLDFNSEAADMSNALSRIFDTVDKASYVYQRQRVFEEKYRDYIPLATKIDDLSNELSRVNRQLDRSQRDLVYLKDIDNYLFGSSDVPTLANSSSIVDKIRAINIDMASRDRSILPTLTNNLSFIIKKIRSIETDVTSQDRFFLTAALAIVTVTRQSKNKTKAKVSCVS